MKVLIVDDNQFNRQLLGMIVEDCDHEYSFAENGQVAIDRIEQDPSIDLVLMHVNMPVMDGLEATRHIKASFADRQIPVVFVTALDNEETLSECLAINGDDFVPKPINEVVLNAKLKAHSRTIEFYRELKNSHQQLAYHGRQIEREHNIIENIFNRCTNRMERRCENVHYYMSPMSQFNGDIYLAERNPIGGVNILLGDFTGHGLAAAIGCLPVSDIFFTMARKQSSLGKIAREINSKLRELLPDNMFFCATLMELDANGDRLTVWSGGMNDILLLNNEQELTGRVCAQHMPLGILENDEFDEAVELITPFFGLYAYVYTDGVIEAKNQNGELFGEKRLLNVLRSTQTNRVSALINTINSFSEGTEQSDDIGVVEVIGAPVTYQDTNADCKQSAHNAKSKRTTLPWQINLHLGVDEIKTEQALPQILRVINSLEYAEKHQSILFALLNELYSNAVDHGLLRLESSIKDQEDGFEQYYKLRKKKLAELQDGEINLEFNVSPEDPGRLHIKVSDSGAGFDSHSVRVGLAENDGAYARGVNLIETLCEQLHYTDKGRTVNAVYNLLA